MPVTGLPKRTMIMAVAVPIVVFGLLNVLLVRPERVAAFEARHQVEVARGERDGRRALVTSQVAKAAAALDEFEARTAQNNHVAEVAIALTNALNSPAVGGVLNLTIAPGTPVDSPIDSMATLFPRKVVHTPVTVTFDAQYDQIARFFKYVGVLPTTFDLRSVELTPRPASRPGFMRAKVSLLVFHRMAPDASR